MIVSIDNKQSTMIDNSDFFNSPKHDKDEKCDEEKNLFLCDSDSDQKKYFIFKDSL